MYERNDSRPRSSLKNLCDRLTSSIPPPWHDIVPPAVGEHMENVIYIVTLSNLVLRSYPLLVSLDAYGQSQL